MTRGRGVILQKYKDGGLSDVKTFNLADGLTWRLGDKTRTETDAAGLDRPARPGRPPAAARLPVVEQVRVDRRPRQQAGVTVLLSAR